MGGAAFRKDFLGHFPTSGPLFALHNLPLKAYHLLAISIFCNEV